MKSTKVHSAALTAFSFLFFALLTANAQCPNSYFKPMSYSVFSGQNYFLYDASSKGDFTGDGRLDLIGYNSNSNNVVIYPRNNQNGFGNPIVVNTQTELFSDNLKWADFERDGDPDLIILNETSPRTVTVYKNNGAASFMPQTATILGINDNIVSGTDINGDQIADLFIFSGNNGGTFFYRFGNADGTFGSPVQVARAEYAFGADFNGDGRTDFPNRSLVTGNLEILYNQGNGTFVTQSTNIPVGNIQAVKDVNNDNIPDLIANSSYRIAVFVNQGSNNFVKTEYDTPTRYACCGQYLPIPMFGDFSGDGFVDMMVGVGQKPYYSIYKNNGAGFFQRTDYNVAAPGFPFDDFDGDGKTDLILFSDRNGKIFGYKNIIVQKNSCAMPGATKIVDFDANRESDETVWNASQGLWKTHSLNLNNTSRADVSFYWGTNGDIPTPGDFDGDGATDYAVFRPSNGVWYIRNSSNESFRFVNFGIGGDVPVASDFDGDDKTDIAVFRPSNGVWYFIKSSNDQFSSLQWGIAEDKPLAADFDGDGKTDVAVYRPSNGNWYVLKSSDNRFYGLQWGLSDDKPLPADYDGDGKADVTVFRASQNAWYILSSFNSQYFGYVFGAAGDVVQPGDWNGDGVFDVGVYRPSSKIWYSSTNTEGVVFGANADSPIGLQNNIY